MKIKGNTLNPETPSEQKNLDSNSHMLKIKDGKNAINLNN